jgi:hypothetical protein
VDFIHRIAIFYEISRTFCPNFAFYWFITNLLILVVSQISAHALCHFPHSVRLEHIYPLTLYVKQDLYRIMVFCFGYGILVLFVLCIVPFVYSIKKFYEGEYKKSLYLFIIICIFLLIFMRIKLYYPYLFK